MVFGLIAADAADAASVADVVPASTGFCCSELLTSTKAGFSFLGAILITV